VTVRAHRMWMKLRALLRSRTNARQLDDEIQFHLDPIVVRRPKTPSVRPAALGLALGLAGGVATAKMIRSCFTACDHWTQACSHRSR
jgi:hypothetical protein